MAVQRASLTYRGDREFFCPVCQTAVSGFDQFRDRPNARCPTCLGLERHRFLSYLIDRLSPLVSSGRVLDIAPQYGITTQLKDLVGSEYVGLDIESRHRDVSALGDLQHLPFRDGVFDTVICYHVLEHIPDDGAALSEITRVMSPHGLMIFQVPYRERDLTIEDVDASPEHRLARFGQEDHVRFYGRDIVDRFSAAGLTSSLLYPDGLLDEAERVRFGLPRVSARHEPVWLCRRTPVTAPGAATPN